MDQATTRGENHGVRPRRPFPAEDLQPGPGARPGSIDRVAHAGIGGRGADPPHQPGRHPPAARFETLSSPRSAAASELAAEAGSRRSPGPGVDVRGDLRALYLVA